MKFYNLYNELQIKPKIKSNSNLPKNRKEKRLLVKKFGINEKEYNLWDNLGLLKCFDE